MKRFATIALNVVGFIGVVVIGLSALVIVVGMLFGGWLVDWADPHDALATPETASAPGRQP